LRRFMLGQICFNQNYIDIFVNENLEE